jgi:23S rRNA (adenine2030-N6)-methyltransferase
VAVDPVSDKATAAVQARRSLLQWGNDRPSLFNVLSRMNYRHAFHAGNFADVVKHIVLTRIISYLHEKPSALRVIDTHAGAGRYDLTSAEAQRGGEWQSGIGRLLQAELDPATAALIKPYLDIVRSFNPEGDIVAYPGSPLVARGLLRPQDSMVVCELEPAARKQLVASLRNDRQARVVAIDGWTALPAYVPPQERRGVVLIDPPFERADEFERLAAGFEAALTKWPTGIYVLWYPLKDIRAVARLGQQVTEAITRSFPSAVQPDRKTLSERLLQIDFQTGKTVRSEGGLTAAGLLVVNPPWTLARDMTAIAPALAKILGQDGEGRFRIGNHNL